MTTRLLPLSPNPNANDIARIVQVCTANGYEIDAATAEAAWQAHSDGFAAGWLGLPNDDTRLLNIILAYTRAET